VSSVGHLSADAFGGATQKLLWAKQHIANMERALAAVHQADDSPFSAKGDPEAEIGTSVGIDFSSVLRSMPALRLTAGDAVHNLRCALDHLAWAIVSAYKEPDPRLYFPIDVELESLKRHRGLIEIQSVAPDIAELIVNEIKPYGAGNPFVKLNQLDRADKHRILLVHRATGSVLIYAAKDDDDVPERTVESFILVAPSGRLPKPGSKAAIHNEKFRSVAFDVRFDAGLPCENEPVVPTLNMFAEVVAGVIRTLATYVEGR
jgi:hypothetical protein